MENEKEDEVIHLTKMQYENFGKEFLKNYLSHGYGTMPKREIDILVFHLISESKDIKGKPNYKIANKLRLTESRVKSLRLESSLKHKPANHKAVLGDIVYQLIEEMKKPEFDGTHISIGLEDPVYKREFEYAVKHSGNHVEYGINREILKVNPLHLLEIILDNVEDGEQEFIKLVKAHIKGKEKQNKIIDKSLTLRQKINKLGNELSDKSGLVGLMTQAGGLIVGI